MNSYYRKKYEKWLKFEPKLQVADIVFIRNKKGMIPQVIRKFSDNSYWNHVGLVLMTPDKKNLFQNTLIIEAADYGIEIHRMQRYVKNFKTYDIGIKRVPNLTEDEKKKVIAFMFNNVDVPYDYTRLTGAILRHLLGENFPLLKRELFINSANFICSSFIQKAFYMAMPKEKKQNVYFKDCISSLLDLEDIYPSHIARSKKCKWIYNKH